jgi:predicted O-methyltransferase YrrM
MAVKCCTRPSILRVLPKIVRRHVPDSVRHSPRLRALALRAGLIPPRTMHSPAESDLLRELAADRRRAVEIGVYEGSSALVLLGALALDAELHLIEPFGKGMDWWEPADERAVKAVVRRAARRRGGPSVRWHVMTSEVAARDWDLAVDLVFIDGDHTEAACRLDWELWHGFVEPGGVVAFHDARGGDPGPTAVVERLFGVSGHGPPGWSVCDERDTIVAVRRDPLS